MDEHEDPDDRLSQRPPAEGVRIIKAEEAQAALDAGQVAGRRPEDAPRFGDVPPPPAGPRPAHRFPLPDSVDPASAVPRPPVRAEERWSPVAAAGEDPPADRQEPPIARPAPPTVQPTPPVAEERRAAPRPVMSDTQPRPPEGQQSLNVDTGRTPATEGRPLPVVGGSEYGMTVQGGGDAELPHWTDPPTGQVPRIRPEGMEADDPTEDELAAWQALGSRGLHWRDKNVSDWDDLEDMGALEDDAAPLGALDTSRSEHSDMFSFDEQFERLEEERSGQFPVVDPAAEPPSPAAGVTATATRGSHRSGGRGRPDGGRRAASRPAAGGTCRRPWSSAIGLLVALLIAYFVGAWLPMIVSAVVVTACALELYNVMQHRGFPARHPARRLRHGGGHVGRLLAR